MTVLVAFQLGCRLLSVGATIACTIDVEERRTNEENMQRSEETSNLALLHHCCFFIYMLKRHYRILLAPARDHSCLSARWRL